MDEKVKNMLEPVWKAGQVYRETFAMIREDGECRSRFLYLPKEILRVESYDGTLLYEEGRDYRIEKDCLVRTADSRIPCTGWERFYLPGREAAEEEQKHREEPLGFGPVETQQGTYVTLNAVGAPQWVTEFQAAVSYTAEDTWKGSVPERQGNLLPKFSRLVREGRTPRIVFYGDSISCGYDCSGKYGQKPGQPIWTELVAAGLEEEYDVKLETWNTSVGGVDSDWAAEHAAEHAGNYRPDLVILGFGMNDRCRGGEYRRKTEALMEAVRQLVPDVEFLLIATTLPNPLLHTRPFYFCGYQEEQGEALRQLRRMGIAVADVQVVQRELMKKKRYIDLTGNLLNHPNDYLARVQAQVVLETLKMP